MLGRSVVVPTRPSPGVVRFRPPTAGRLVIGQEPMRPLAAGHVAERGSARGKLLVRRTVADAARRGKLPIGEMVGIEEAECLGHARYDEASRRLPREYPAHVDIPQIK